MILLNTSLPKGIAYVETKGLDGETNLKQKISRSEVIPLVSSDANLFANLTGATITCDMPNADLYKFSGQLKLNDGALIPLGND